MIKAVAQGPDGRPLLILGLSRKNTERLLEGRPIPVELRDLFGIDAVVLIVAGETEDAIVDELRAHASPEIEMTVEVECRTPFPPSGPRGKG